MIVYTLVLIHLTYASISLYLHRSLAHHSVTFHPVLAHIIRCYLWLTSAMNASVTVAAHRLHHAHSDTEKDPFNPNPNWRKFFFKQIWLFAAPYDSKTITSRWIWIYSRDIPDDWVERNVYNRFHYLGPLIMLSINLLLFGLMGIAITAAQFLGVVLYNFMIAGMAHTTGYKNAKLRDKSHNIIPWGIIFCGEELHNNHHIKASSANLSIKWYEIDLGFAYVYILSKLGLASYKTA